MTPESETLTISLLCSFFNGEKSRLFVTDKIKINLGIELGPFSPNDFIIQESNLKHSTTTNNLQRMTWYNAVYRIITKERHARDK